LILYAVLYEISGHVLAPLVMGQAVKLNPLVILLATMVGIVLGGVVGLLLSVPVAAVLKVVWNFFYPRLAPRWGLEPSPVRPVPATPPDHGAGSAFPPRARG
jgi:predicted PurR-regulated permease PerM